MRSLSNRVEKVERALEPDNKGEWLKFPCRDGSFIEVPGCRSLADVVALIGIGRDNATVDETERK